MFDKLLASIGDFFSGLLTRDVKTILALPVRVEAKIEAFLGTTHDAIAAAEAEITEIMDEANKRVDELRTTIANHQAQIAKAEAFKATLTLSQG